jgi:hypothetical protein
LDGLSRAGDARDGFWFLFFECLKNEGLEWVMGGEMDGMRLIYRPIPLPSSSPPKLFKAHPGTQSNRSPRVMHGWGPKKLPHRTISVDLAKFWPIISEQ